MSPIAPYLKLRSVVVFSVIATYRVRAKIAAHSKDRMDARMRGILVLALMALSDFLAQAQIIPSGWSGCTVPGGKGMICNGIAAPSKEQGKPKLWVADFIVKPGAALEEPSSSSDRLILGINGGDLVNEKAPYLHVSLEKDAVTLMPKEEPFRLRNTSSDEVKFRLIEIQR